ncbi:hypothetical protein ES702_05892 [subsurface metagenome]
MPNAKQLITTSVIALVAVAIATRVPQLRQLLGI